MIRHYRIHDKRTGRPIGHVPLTLERAEEEVAELDIESLVVREDIVSRARRSLSYARSGMVRELVREVERLRGVRR